MISYSKVESNRFNINVHRGVIEDNPINEVLEYARAFSPDLIILRLSATSIENHYQLQQIENYQVLLTDALVYYQTDFTKFDLKEIKNNLEFISINKDNKVELQNLVPIIFKEYKNHYFANPILENKLISEGYIEWAQNYCSDEHDDKISWLIYKEQELIGFATCSFSTSEKVCEGVLYGVHPNFAGGGIYTDIIRFTQNYFKKLGFEKMIVSTQLQNYAVQKVWQRENFLINKAFYTYHLNKIGTKNTL